MSPRRQTGKTFSGVLIEASVGPFADGGLDEAFRLAVGARSVDTSANVFKLEIAAGVSEEVGVKAGAIIHDAARSDAEAGEVGHGLTEEIAGGSGGFVRQHSGEGDARVVVDGDIEKFPARAACLVLRISGDAMA